MSKYRVLSNPETCAKNISKSEMFYLLSVDVGRLSCQTVCSVFKVFPGARGFEYRLVNLYVLGRTPETKHFERQALDLKKIIEAFCPREVVIDGNGLKISSLLLKNNLKKIL